MLYKCYESGAVPELFGASVRHSPAHLEISKRGWTIRLSARPKFGLVFVFSLVCFSYPFSVPLVGASTGNSWVAAVAGQGRDNHLLP